MKRRGDERSTPPISQQGSRPRSGLHSWKPRMRLLADALANLEATQKQLEKVRGKQPAYEADGGDPKRRLRSVIERSEEQDEGETDKTTMSTRGCLENMIAKHSSTALGDRLLEALNGLPITVDGPRERRKHTKVARSAIKATACLRHEPVALLEGLISENLRKKKSS